MDGILEDMGYVLEGKLPTDNDDVLNDSTEDAVNDRNNDVLEKLAGKRIDGKQEETEQRREDEVLIEDDDVLREITEDDIDEAIDDDGETVADATFSNDVVDTDGNCGVECNIWEDDSDEREQLPPYQPCKQIFCPEVLLHWKCPCSSFLASQ